MLGHAGVHSPPRLMCAVSKVEHTPGKTWPAAALLLRGGGPGALRCSVMPHQHPACRQHARASSLCYNSKLITLLAPHLHPHSRIVIRQVYSLLRLLFQRSWWSIQTVHGTPEQRQCADALFGSLLCCWTMAGFQGRHATPACVLLVGDTGSEAEPQEIPPCQQHASGFGKSVP